jgi:type II secretory ATPase GspE/PulE/Tfp pilus assembly ATPase PilB-like protein
MPTPIVIITGPTGSGKTMFGRGCAACRYTGYKGRVCVIELLVLKVLLHDATLSAEILRLANSSFFAGLNKIETVRAAITRPGFQRIVNLAVVCAQREQFRPDDRELAGWIGQLWRHSLARAVAGK